MLDIHVNAMIWRIFMSATVKDAVHFGQDYQDNLQPRTGTSKRSSSCAIFGR